MYETRSLGRQHRRQRIDYDQDDYYNHQVEYRMDIEAHNNCIELYYYLKGVRVSDVALQILNKLTQLRSVLGILPRKPEAFRETRYDRKAGPVVWENIAKKPKDEIDKVLRGPPDAKKQVFGKVDQALELQKLISEHIVNMHVESQNIIKQGAKPASGKENQVLQLQKVISEHITSMQVQIQSIIRGPDIETYSSRVLFVAAEMGNINFVVELLRQYPDLIWKVNDNNQTIFHIAVINRHEGIYNILYEIGAMRDSVTSLEDENGNNMLHLVAKIANKRRLEDVSGVAFQMQRELLWFKDVKRMIPASYRDRRNKDGLTPQELFTKEHEGLRAQTFTVHGGYQNNGIPIFSGNLAFMILVLSDAISLLSSSASTMMFISFLTSRFAERDFIESLPIKMLIILITLFLSITTMMIAFSVNFKVLYRTYRG
ncbi:ankyrin repeat-containing domain, PGG domain protein [Tanacetum coccineum]